MADLEQQVTKNQSITHILFAIIGLRNTMTPFLVLIGSVCR